jgi:hypothetical protein
VENVNGYFFDFEEPPGFADFFAALGPTGLPSRIAASFVGIGMFSSV